jgi:hypothetical protein
MMSITRYELRTLASLPWPHGLGKSEYRRLERRLATLLGHRHLEPAIHKRAFETSSEYKTVVLEELQARAWSSDVIDVAADAAALAGTAPLLGVDLTNEEHWRTWAREQPTSNPFVRLWLTSPPDITAGILDARHRITYLRFMCAPSFSVLVRCAR